MTLNVKVRGGITPWNSIITSYWLINGYSFVLEKHQINGNIYWLLYSEDCPQIHVNSSCISLPDGVSREEIVYLLAERIIFIYDMFIKLNISGWINRN